MRIQQAVNQPDQKADMERFSPKPLAPGAIAAMTVKILAIGSVALGTLWWLSQ